MATAGEQPEWNERAKSRGHQAIPLQSVQFVQRAPMIAALLESLGVEIQTLLGSSAELVTKLEGKTFNVFHVEDAKGSAHIPAQQEFVVPYGIHSVIGFGGVLTSGELFAVIMFTRVRVARSSADRFRNIALDVKALLHGFGDARVFG